MSTLRQQSKPNIRAFSRDYATTNVMCFIVSGVRCAVCGVRCAVCGVRCSVRLPLVLKLKSANND